MECIGNGMSIYDALLHTIALIYLDTINSFSNQILKRAWT